MNTINHALWGATIGRTVGLPLEGAIIGALPDLLSVPILAVYTKKSGTTSPAAMPMWAMHWYTILHNWIFGLSLILVGAIFGKTYAILATAYFLHIAIDAFVHRDYATPFLSPLTKIKISGYSASEHKWIQILDIFLIVMVNIILSRR